jgi:hypothetical protein
VVECGKKKFKPMELILIVIKFGASDEFIYAFDYMAEK